MRKGEREKEWVTEGKLEGVKGRKRERGRWKIGRVRDRQKYRVKDGKKEIRVERKEMKSEKLRYR